jgi:hypothetical protein
MLESSLSVLQALGEVSVNPLFKLIDQTHQRLHAEVCA